LDLGCGKDKLPGAVGMDMNLASHADVIHDLDERPWPFEDNRFEHVRAQDVLEHVADFMGVMEEIHCVCRAGASVLVRMPFMSSVNFTTDPTHRRAGTSSTFDYFDPESTLGQYSYSKAHFKLREFHYGRFYHGSHVSHMRRWDKRLVPWLEKHSVIYEHYFAYWYPMHDITYQLEVIKP